MTTSKQIKVISVLPNMTPLPQPIDQGVPVTFEAYFLHKIFVKLIQVTNSKKNCEGIMKILQHQMHHKCHS
jgi:hypothetical protein